MTELLPSLQAASLRRAVTDYVTTAISLADPSVDSALGGFLGNEQTGIFLGPYIRTRLPFAGGDGEQAARDVLLTLPVGFDPYVHQIQAFRRLSTAPHLPGARDAAGFRLPEPTIVTTGTGSGKTESFLLPVLDHVARARTAGVGGIKALILYPMNALANDQAARLAHTITDTPAYRGITAALYTGEAAAQPRTRVDAHGLITDREMIRRDVPDVLLTNYKMLDQLLLRSADRPLWDRSAQSLRYLILDEFHTYDGAQGTDVAMLLRRLRIVLEGRAPGAVHMTPVATSATLGDTEADLHEPGGILAFARTVFGTPFGPDAVITETRRGLDDFLGASRRAIARATEHGGGGDASPVPVTPAAPALAPFSEAHPGPGRGDGTDDPEALTRDVLETLWRLEDAPTPGGVDETEDAGSGVMAWAHARGVPSGDLLLAHPVVRNLLDATTRAVHLTDLARTLLPLVPDDLATRGFTTALLAALSHARAVGDRRTMPSLEVHLWIREINRVDRIVSSAPAFTWSDTTSERTAWALPAVYCRHCGRSGWGITTRAVGDELDLRPDVIREDSVRHPDRFRAALLDVTTTAPDPENREGPLPAVRRYLNPDASSLDRQAPSEEDPDAPVVPVLVFTGTDAEERSRTSTCPACAEKDGIRFVATRLATLLSVSLTGLFGTAGLDEAERKALVFTDSVQDAAHRAGFVEARSHTLTQRSVILAALDKTPRALPEIVSRMLADARTPEQRYRLLHPGVADAESLEPFWTAGVPGRRRFPASAQRRAANLIDKRLRFDVGLELGLTGQVGRTLLLTGSAVAQVRATDAEIDTAADRALRGLEMSLLGDQRNATRRWVRGVLERLRTRGAIAHPWLEPYRRRGGMLHQLWGGRPSPDVMPAFPPGRALPGIPAVGPRPARSELEDAVSRAGWYADWTARTLGRERGVASSLVRPLLEALTELGILDAVSADEGTGLRSFAIIADRIEASRPDQPADQETPALVCPECHETVTGTSAVLAALAGGPCTRYRCPGSLRSRGIPAGYYRTLYRGDMRRVVAREHTSLLTNDERLTYETQFKARATTPGAPNVLVATPTLEMGIDIGDLSAVMLASVPRTVASYLQRVGRAGRATGNALDVTLVAGRGRTTGLFTEPTDLLNGTVRSPGAYLSSEEILRRQFLASVMDALAGDARVTPPHPRSPVLASSASGTYLGAVLEEMRHHGPRRLDAFLERFETGGRAWDGLTDRAREDLRRWALDVTDGTTGLERAVHDAVRAWNAEVEDLRRRRARINANLDELQRISDRADREESHQALTAENLLLQAHEEEIGVAPVLTEQEREDETRRLRGSAGRTGAEIVAAESAHWIGVLERFALLPNFTLVDDAVALDATLTWQDESGRWQHETSTLQRSGRPALTELAPGSHFYAHGRELEIDAVDVGVDGRALRTTAFCPVCGLAHDFTDQPVPATCPACASAEIADPGQHRSVIDLTRVYSTMRRSRTRIGDSADERVRTPFETALSVSFDGATTRARWSVREIGLGVTLHRGTTLTRLNLGPTQRVAGKIRLAGEERTAPGFLVCAECGHVDRDTGSNRPEEHQRWCAHRYAAESANRSVLLTRSMRTETVVLTIPPVVLEDSDDAGLWTWIAALGLGIERRFGGSIGNLDMDVITAPGRPGERALLLSDSVPGGTGYLMELADAAGIWDLLTHALHALRTCPCADEPVAACHRCLTSRVPAARHGLMSRPAAIDLLERLVGEDAEIGTMGWDVAADELDGSSITESPLEDRFRRAFRAAVAHLPDVRVTTRRGDRGDVVTVESNGRTFRLSPQVDIAGSRPDFVLTWPGSDVEGIAVFTDGVAFHATSEINRLADDAEKRTAVRASGYLVLTVTHADLIEREDATSAPQPTSLPPLLVPATVDRWESTVRPGSAIDSRLVRASPIDLLVDVITRGTTAPWRALGEILPALLVRPGGTGDLTEVDPDAPYDLARQVLAGQLLLPPGPESAHRAVVRRHDALTAIGVLTPGRRSTTLVLDDRPAAMRREDHPDAWRAWGRLANLAQGDPYGTTLHLTTASLLTRSASRERGTPPAPVPTAAPRVDVAVPETPVRVDDTPLTGPWADALEDTVTESERVVLRLAARRGAPLPVVGEEFGRGIPLDLAWPEQRVAYVAAPLDPAEASDLEDAGWRIVGPETDGVLQHLGLITEDTP